MILYNKNNITISTIEEQDKEIVLKYYQENTFNCDYESGSLRPTIKEFIKIMDSIIYDNNDEENILIIKNNNKAIGYLSMFVEYDRLVLGHIAMDKKQRNKGYGKLLTELSILIAENEDRNIRLYCHYNNRFLKELGFTTSDNIHYYYHTNKKKNNLPKLFVSIDEYKKRQEQKQEENLERFNKILKLIKI